MVAAIVETYGRATEAQTAAGRDWYPTAGRMCQTIADSAGVAQYSVALALAALSPRNPWKWNVADCYAFAHAAGDPAGEMPTTATTFVDNRERAWYALRHGEAAWKSAAPKVRAFVSAVTGNPLSVVVDVWAIRIATRGALDTVRGHEYGPVAAAYEDAARMLHIMPRDLQAITWVVAEAEGLGSKRRGRHGETFKRGTAPAVVAMFMEHKPWCTAWSPCHSTREV
jgi:hypothetical protein